MSPDLLAAINTLVDHFLRPFAGAPARNPSLPSIHARTSPTAFHLLSTPGAHFAYEIRPVPPTPPPDQN